MSIYIQEVLGLLNRDKKVDKLDPIRDHIEFGRLYKDSTINTASSYIPKMEPLIIKWGDFLCEVTKGLTSTKTGSGNVGFLPVYTTPADEECATATLIDSIVTQNTIGDTITIGGNLIVTGNVVHGTDVVGTPAQTTTINSNLKLEGPVYDSQGTIGQSNKILAGLADGRTIWSDGGFLVPTVGFDTLPMSETANWDQSSGFRNAFINLNDTSVAYRVIQGMTPLSDGMTGVVIAENTKTGSDLANGAIRFNNWTNGARTVTNKVSWFEPTIPQLGYNTSNLKFGESIKIKYHYYDADSTNSVLYWESCCKLYSSNTCPTTTGATYTIDEEGSVTNSMTVIDDGYGGYGLTFSIVGGSPANGTLLFDTGTGVFTFTPDANWYGTTSFQFQVTDGYCNSNISTILIVVNNIVDPPLWTSTDPVTLNTYPNLTGNDVWTYNWTTNDPDTACNDLTYVITVDGVEIYPAAGSSWLTFTDNGDCTGTLSGSYPSAGGNFTVQMIVNDPDGGSDTQSFTIGGLAVTQNTYFVSWQDSSGSMGDTIKATAQISSVPLVYCKTDILTGSQIQVLSQYTPNMPQYGLINDINNISKDSSLIVRAAYSGYSDSVTCASADSPCSGNTPIENLTNGMNYTITNDGAGNVNISVTVVDNPAGLVAFLDGSGDVAYPDVTGTFTYTLTSQAVDYQLEILFNWGLKGMLVTYPGIPANTFVGSIADRSGGGGTRTINLVDINGDPYNHGLTPTAVPVDFQFNLTESMRIIDYQDSNNLRNLLQDYYATNGTYSSGNTNPATNGSDMYDSHIIWGHSRQERQIQMMSNKGLGGTIGSAGTFPDADNVVFLSFGDESSFYYLSPSQTGTGTWSDRANSVVQRIEDDVIELRDYISTMETTAGTNSIYRSTFFQTITTDSNRLLPLVSDVGGLLQYGINGSVFTPPAASAYTNAAFQDMVDYATNGPIRSKYRSGLSNNSTQSYWYNQIKAALLDHGFIV